MQEKFINATQTQVATKVSTKTQILLGLMIATCIGGMFAITVGINKSTNKPIEVETKDDAEGKNGHCTSMCDWEHCTEVCSKPCYVGGNCYATYANDFGDITNIACGPCSGSINNVSHNMIKGESSNLNTKYPLTDEIKQKSVITKLDNRTTKYDYIIGENGEIITPQIKDIDGGGGGNCFCHLGLCACGSYCVSGEIYDYEDDNENHTGSYTQVTVCRPNYANTSGFTRSEINGSGE